MKEGTLSLLHGTSWRPRGKPYYCKNVTPLRLISNAYWQSQINKDAK